MPNNFHSDILYDKNESGFSLHHLPFGVFRYDGISKAHIGVRLGDFLIDLTLLELDEVVKTGAHDLLFQSSGLNKFMSGGKSIWQNTRKQIQSLFSSSSEISSEFIEKYTVPISDITLLLPVLVGDYTDFYSSREHATNVGKLFRDPENALQPNWLHLPVGYHGRSSSIVPSDTPIKRPCGQILNKTGVPEYGQTRALDFELEMGFYTGKGKPLGDRISVQEAEDYIFGLSLVNDWSARDIQKWEYIPLGPFLGKNFATSVSHWITPLEALEPFRTRGPIQNNPRPLSYLQSKRDATFDIHLRIYLNDQEISSTNFKKLYWNMSQQLAHHTVNGCNIRPGDLLASGTISGSEQNSEGCLLEKTHGGKKKIILHSGDERIYLEDGDTVTLQAYCEDENQLLQFGSVSGQIIPAQL